MAPQNSTLLHENAELVADKIIRYSPILTLPNENDCDSANSADEHSDDVRRKKSIHNFGTVDTQVRHPAPSTHTPTATHTHERIKTIKSPEIESNYYEWIEL